MIGRCAAPPMPTEGTLPTTKTGLESLFAKIAPSRIALGVGTHSPWVSRHLAGMGQRWLPLVPLRIGASLDWWGTARSSVDHIWT